jgi:hypothetical protein
MNTPRAKILDKEIYVVDTIEATANDIAHDVQAYESVSLLRVIADLGNHIYRSRLDFTLYRQVLVNDSFLIFSAIFVLNCESTPNGIDASRADLQILFKKLWFIYDKDCAEEDITPDEILLRLAYRQFPHQQELLNGFTRSIYIYRRIWPNRTQMLENDIFNETLGLTFDQVFMHVFLRLSSEQSYFYKLDQTTLNKMNGSLNVAISMTSEAAFLNWASRSANDICEYAGSLDNPLKKYPIINIGIVSERTDQDAFLMLTKNCLYQKVAHYLYYDFIERYRGERGSNIFKTTYGQAFQEYVGELLKAHFRSWDVIPELPYTKAKNSVSTVDWIVSRGDKLILFEVKQSSIFLETKQSGSMESFRKDCKRTLDVAFTQLQTTKTDIEAQSFDELKFMGNARSIEMVCIVADPLYFGNMLLSMIREEYSEMHVINISDLEDILEVQKKDQSLHYLLSKKRKRRRLQGMDFNEYIISVLKGRVHRSSQFLRDIFDEYITGLKQ